MVYARTSHNRSVYASALKRLGVPQGQVGRPTASLPRLATPTVWAGVNASHCPITCPNRRKQPERYAQVLQLFKKFLSKIFFKIIVKKMAVRHEWTLILEFFLNYYVTYEKCLIKMCRRLYQKIFCKTYCDELTMSNYHA